MVVVKQVEVWLVLVVKLVEEWPVMEAVVVVVLELRSEDFAGVVAVEFEEVELMELRLVQL